MSKKIHAAFTIIEIAVVLTISIVLLMLGTISLSTAERRNRDSERKADMDMMIQCLESGYINTNTYIGTIADMSLCPKSKDFMTPPDASAVATVLATNTSTTLEGIRPIPTKTTYVFQPLTETGALCTNNCKTYNLYYYSEYENYVVKVTGGR